MSLRAVAEDIDRLDAALDVARGRAGTDAVATAEAVVLRACERLERGPRSVVAALAGGTGSGTSSLSNALVGQDLSPVSPVRPTTSSALLWSVGTPDHDLLEWLGVGDRRIVAPRPDLPEGLVVVDLPDHDSVRTAHREVVDRLVGVVDVVVVVVDPLKYAQRSLYEGYLEPLAGHADVVVVVLNQIDLLDAEGERRCVSDLVRLLDEVGLGRSRVLVTSAVTGRGVDELREILAEQARSRRAVAERISADLAVAAGALADGLDPAADLGGPEPLIDALADAADLSGAVRSALLTYRERALAATRPPLTDWAVRLGRRIVRPALPAAAVALARSRMADGRTAPPPQDERGSSDPPAAGGAGGVPSQAHGSGDVALRHALSRIVGPLRTGVPGPWRARLDDLAQNLTAQLPARTREALELVALRPPRRWWWAVVAFWWTLVEIAVIAGAGWLTGLALVAWLRLPEPPTAQVGALDLPTLLLLAGIPLWLVTRLARGIAVRRGAARHAARSARRLRAQVRDAVEAALTPLREEVKARDRLVTFLAGIVTEPVRTTGHEADAADRAGGSRSAALLRDPR